MLASQTTYGFVVPIAGPDNTVDTRSPAFWVPTTNVRGSTAPEHESAPEPLAHAFDTGLPAAECIVQPSVAGHEEGSLSVSSAAKPYDVHV
jgi:hypothetical protein